MLYCINVLQVIIAVFLKYFQTNKNTFVGDIKHQNDLKVKSDTFTLFISGLM